MNKLLIGMHALKIILIAIIRIRVLVCSQLKNSDIFESLSLQHQVFPSRLLSDRVVNCDKRGNCSRKDNISLTIGTASKLSHEDVRKGLNQAIKENIVSIDPIKGSVNPIFIKGSKIYICADGVNECFNSCCKDGFCSDPSNICTSALKGSSAIIYSTCIAFFLLVCFYWIVFGYIGVRYTKQRARIQLRQDKLNKADNPASQLKSNAFNTLEDFEDGFNNRPLSGIMISQNHPHKPITKKLKDQDEDNKMDEKGNFNSDKSVKNPSIKEL